MLISAVSLFCANSAAQDNTAAGMDFIKLATERYSVRKFSSKPVDQDIIDKIIQAGKVAPTAVNSQPQKIYVVKSEEIMKKLKHASPCIYGAPHCFVFCYNDKTVVKRGKNGNYGDIDVTIVLTHMMLEAANLGIGTCIVGYYDTELVRKALDMPDDIHPVLLLPFGYASDKAEPSPKHLSYRSLEETVEYK